MITVESILSISAQQGATCMYSREQLEIFPQEKLDAIFAGIAALEKRRPWKREMKIPPLRRGRKKKSKKVS